MYGDIFFARVYTVILNWTLQIQSRNIQISQQQTGETILINSASRKLKAHAKCISQTFVFVKSGYVLRVF